MKRRRAPGARLECVPVTPERHADFERLFGARGACAGCWCQHPRLPRREYEAGRGEGNRLRMAGQIAKGPVPGLLAYRDGEPVGWCSIEPRARFLRLEASRVLAPVDDQPVWSIVCLFIARPARRQGVSRALITAACDRAREQGARLVEAYPIDPRDREVPAAFAWTGLLPAYLACGFREVARRSAGRPIVRRVLTRR